MKKIILGSIAIMAIAAVAAVNVNLNSQSEKLSAMMLANVEALAQGESNNQGWDEDKQESEHYMNGNLYKKSKIVNCYAGGPNSQCTSGCFYQVKNSDESWTSWLNC
ncbi:hypothetical protein FACS189440_20560 [Bacteroidia bacterium]|nr:hypothetical protein FACS189440_20560 [Bacteroidia bacterium]